MRHKTLRNNLSRFLNVVSVQTAVALLFLIVAPAAFGQQDIQKADIPFSFQVGTKTLPPGHYVLTIDLSDETVMVQGQNGGALEEWVTEMAPQPNEKDAYLVFDKVGDKYYLSELWSPGKKGVLTHVTKEDHDHRTVPCTS